MKREDTKRIYVGNVAVGNGARVTVQSMTNTDTKDVESTVKQIKEFESVGCDISRSAINDLEDAKAIPIIKSMTNIPFVADIQFHHKLSIAAIENGCDCIRINPGNIGGIDRVKEIVDCCKHHKISMRIGVNSGSVNQKFIDKYHGVNVDSICYSCLDQIRMIEDMGFDDIKLSLKSSNVNMSIKAYEKMSELCNYPLHVGITEAGPSTKGIIKSSVGIGSILSKGIGDTIRVSLTGDPKEEIIVGRQILMSLGLLNEGIEIISCPTCARTKIDLISLVNEAEKKLDKIDKHIKVAIMGCVVNGPGEAKEADIGIAGGNGVGLIFKKGEIVRKVKEEELLDVLIEEIERL
ncbi:flavodoxin-dependent (E)-4-hydroxy-3-methylbut-2-enyl-diphosphate synthase [Finegoldia magna]|uniref:flavodoxin-dependent (E)-4-hydroxy-3-methylbut-2-enyl-diphosphate synthase n=1 Tax=Finegoldia magna TaxID=1260 RepID=UPI0028054C2B|nr:flavodoxin-dependent (E)-4-hydroxy-3-methylbut-2-enyl-diphosphate synthase [Finegoldia magna]MDU5069569.1 flavodoxin-dependent (E)-4-hydroxy-3-methylbut-2-enyl-diphosphate synthase [Finegoldia magna]